MASRLLLSLRTWGDSDVVGDALVPCGRRHLCVLVRVPQELHGRRLDAVHPDLPAKEAECRLSRRFAEAIVAAVVVVWLVAVMAAIIDPTRAEIAGQVSLIMGPVAGVAGAILAVSKAQNGNGKNGNGHNGKKGG